MANFLKKLIPWRRGMVEASASGFKIGQNPPAEFVLVTDSASASQLFTRMGKRFRKVWQEQRRFTPPFQLEFGALPGKRRYFYVARWDEQGWLFEETPTGWLVSLAEKIVQTGTFVRSTMAIDNVTLFADPNKADGPLRLRSALCGPELRTYPVYESELLALMQLTARDGQE